MKVVYPNLVAEISRRGIKKSSIAKVAGVSVRALHNKCAGVSPFTWPEVCAISETFFPDMNKEELFARADRPA